MKPTITIAAALMLLLSGCGRLLFPTDESYYSGGTPEELRLVYYSHIDPDETVEIVGTLKERADAMQRIGIDTEFHVYPGLGHGFGLGAGTSAEGWPDDAAAFREGKMQPALFTKSSKKFAENLLTDCSNRYV